MRRVREVKENLEYIEAAILELEGDLKWMRAVRAAILRGDQDARIRLLRSVGFRGTRQ